MIRFLRAGERAVKDRLVDEIDAETGGMAAGSAAQVVTELIFLLIAENGKRGNGRDELIVAICLKARNGLRGCAERKRESEADLGVAAPV